MSDTPKTDNLCLDLDDGFARQSDLIAFARDLERENAALREDYRKLAKVISRTERSHAREVSFTKLQLGVAKSENAALREQVEELDAKWKMAEDQCFDQVGKIGELERENAALRADKERLDWMASADYWADIAVYRTPQALRAAIDAARKEAQP